MSDIQKNTLRAARAYTERGLAVFPLQAKIPVTDHGVKDAVTSLDAELTATRRHATEPTKILNVVTLSLEKWLERPGTNIGIAIPENIVVADFDPRNGGGKTFEEWLALHGPEWASGPLAYTGGGGWHIWFRYDGRALRKDYAGVDFQRLGKYVVAPPSKTEADYKWAVTLPANLDDLPEMPEWMLDLATPPVAEAKEFHDTTHVFRDQFGDALSEAAHGYTTWGALLAGAGWSYVGGPGGGSGDGDKWRHPSTQNQFSATLKHDCLFIYTPNTPFPVTESGDPRGVTLFSALVTLAFDGDQERCLAALRSAGHLESNEYPDPRALVAAPAPASAPISVESDAEEIDPALMLGGAFIWDETADIEIRWGKGHDVLWAAGESLMIVGPPGVGKTTLAHQIVAGLLGLQAEVLDLPITEATRVLYLAMDRPRQIRRAMRRLFKPEQRELIDERLLVRRGPLMHDLVRAPETFLNLARENDCDIVVVDSLKDAALKLSDDETGGAVNRAIQWCNADSIDVCVLHHQRKGQDGSKPNKLDDVYGSAWLTAGTGSVVCLWGEAGHEQIELIHLKQPLDTVGPLNLEHDHRAGRTTVVAGFDALRYLRMQGSKGASLMDVVRAEHGSETKRDSAKAKKTERRLRSLVSDGIARSADPSNGNGRFAEIRYYVTDDDVRSLVSGPEMLPEMSDS